MTQLISETILLQFERRISFRCAMKKEIQSAMNSGADGIKAQYGGVEEVPKLPVRNPSVRGACRSLC
jgi:hypothetical protein